MSRTNDVGIFHKNRGLRRTRILLRSQISREFSSSLRNKWLVRYSHVNQERRLRKERARICEYTKSLVQDRGQHSRQDLRGARRPGLSTAIDENSIVPVNEHAVKIFEAVADATGHDGWVTVTNRRNYTFVRAFEIEKGRERKKKEREGQRGDE